MQIFRKCLSHGQYKYCMHFLCYLSPINIHTIEQKRGFLFFFFFFCVINSLRSCESWTVFSLASEFQPAHWGQLNNK